MKVAEIFKGAWQTTKELVGGVKPLRRGVGNNKAEERQLMHQSPYPYDGGWYMPGITDKSQDTQQ